MNHSTTRMTADYSQSECTALLDNARQLRRKLESVLGTKNALHHALPVLLVALDDTVQARMVSDALPHRFKELTTNVVMNTLVHLGYLVNEAEFNVSHIDTRLLPCLYMRGDAVQVILQCNDAGILAYDAAQDAIVTLPAKAYNHGTVLLFRKRVLSQSETQDQLRKSTNTGWFRSMLKRFHGLIWQVMGTSALLNFVTLTVPIFTMLIYDRVVGARATQDLNYLAVGFLLTIGIEYALRRLRARQVAWLAARSDFLTASSIMGRLLRLPPSLIERASVASQLSRIKGFEEIRDFFTGPLFLTIMELPFIVVLMLAVAIVGGWIAIVPVIMAAIYILVLLAARGLTRQAMHMAAQHHARRHEMILETFDQMQGLRTSGMQVAWAERFRTASGNASLASFRSSQIAMGLETFAYTLTVFAGLMTLSIGVTNVLSGAMTAGELVACMMLTWRILSPLSMLCTSLPRIEQLYQTIMQVNRLMDMQIESERPSPAQAAKGIQGRIEFQNVGLRYVAGADPVFAGLNFKAQPGEMIAITGSNGSGKSSILKLVNGLYQSQAGNIRIDGMDVRQFNSIDLRRQIAYLPQTPDFFAGSIADNLRIADPLADDIALRAALVDAGALADIEALPNGINTILSGGQNGGLPMTIAYRLSLARVCLSHASIILCDEIPNALLAGHYGETYRGLIQQWRKTRTVVLVTHRADYVRLSDRAIGLRHGALPSVGNPEDILRIIKGAEHEQHLPTRH